MERFEVLVIGGGPAAVTLAKLLGKKKSIAIIRPEDYSMIYCAMPYAVEGIINIEKTFKKDAIVTDAGADLIRTSVTNVDFANKIVHTESGNTYTYDKLVIATGATPFIPPIEGAELEGVTGFKTEDNMRLIIDKIEQGMERAVVVGAGAIGIELALSLNKKGLQVDLVDMATSLLPNLLDSEMSELVYEEVVREGVNIHLNARVNKLTGKRFVQQVHLSNGQIIHFDSIESCNVTKDEEFKGMVIFATGMKAQVEIFQASDLEIGIDGIIVNEKMETNIKDVYAVGDCSQFYSGITSRTVSGKLATNAVPMAKVLGFNLLGQNRKYNGFYNGAATKAGKYFVGGTGLSEKIAKDAGFQVVCAYSEVTSKFPIMPGAKQINLKLIVEKGTKRILGAQILAEEAVTDKIDTLTLAIQNNFTIEQLTQLSYASQPYQSYYPAANLIVLAAEDALKKIS